LRYVSKATKRNETWSMLYRNEGRKLLQKRGFITIPECNQTCIGDTKKRQKSPITNNRINTWNAKSSKLWITTCFCIKICYIIFMLQIHCWKCYMNDGCQWKQNQNSLLRCHFMERYRRICYDTRDVKVNNYSCNHFFSQKTTLEVNDNLDVVISRI
jgi:hypothetical protein